MTDAMAEPMILYGKLPMRGDFIARGLDYRVQERLDGWMAAGMRASRERLGADWQNLYLNAPLWQFAWPAGLAADTALAGVMLPSIDAVGRCFPLLAALTLDLPVPLVAAMAGPWYRAAAEVLLSALAPGTDMAGFEAALADLPGPAALPAPDRPLRHALDQWRLADDETLWWTDGAPTLPPGLFIGRGLPGADDFTCLLGREPDATATLRRLGG